MPASIIDVITVPTGAVRQIGIGSKQPRHAVVLAVVLAAWLAGCAGPAPVPKPDGLGPTEARKAIAAVLPVRTPDADAWAADIHASLATLELPSTVQNLCAVMAVVEQESGYRADPVVPGLSAIAWMEIERRADDAGVPIGLIAALDRRPIADPTLAEALLKIFAGRIVAEIERGHVDESLRATALAVSSSSRTCVWARTAVSRTA